MFALLGQFHIKGKKDWDPYEQAGFLYRRFKNHAVSAKVLSAELGLSTKKVNHLIETYEFMVDHDEVDTSRWSYYDEYFKSNTIRKARQQYPAMDSLVVESIKTGAIDRAMDLRDQLPTVAGAPAILKKFAEGKLTLEKAHERAVDSGADSVPYKKAATFRRWITQQNIDSLLAGCPQKVRDKLLFEAEQDRGPDCSVEEKALLIVVFASSWAADSAGAILRSPACSSAASEVWRSLPASDQLLTRSLFRRIAIRSAISLTKHLVEDGRGGRDLSCHKRHPANAHHAQWHTALL